MSRPLKTQASEHYTNDPALAVDTSAVGYANFYPFSFIFNPILKYSGISLGCEGPSSGDSRSPS